MSYVAALDAADASLGGKARSLARLAAAGLLTPPGFAVTDALFRALCPTVDVPGSFGEATWAALAQCRERIEKAPWPRGFAEQLGAGLRRVGADSFSVRSSFAGEDMAGALAAGVYESYLNLPAAEVEGALRRVLASALSPGAAAYAAAHGRKAGEAPVSVLIHAYLPGAAEGSAAFAPEARAEPELMIRRGSLPAAAQLELRSVLEKLAREQGPVEIEWVLCEQGLVYLQLRPFQAKPPVLEWSGWGDLPPGSDRAVWHWDAAHNPLPLSPAQAGLVELVDQHCRVGIRQRVLGGYLFYSLDVRPLPAPMEGTARDYFERLRLDYETRRSALGPVPALESALSLFTWVYERIFGVLQPALKRTRRQLRDFLHQHAPEQLSLLPGLLTGVPSMAEERRRRASAIGSATTDEERTAATEDYLRWFGDEAPIWDVSAPTYAEDRSPLLLDRLVSGAARALDWRVADARVAGQLSHHQREAWQKMLALARDAVSLSEADDWLYARAQTSIRRSLLAIGHDLEHSGRLADATDVFILPLEVVRTAAEQGVDLVALAAAGRTTWQAQRKNPPPVAAHASGKAVRGHGTGGQTVGRVALHRSGEIRSLPEDAVLLARTILPTELPLVAAAAIVTETGGPLDHVAAQARERGIPAVIGAAGAAATFADGDLVLVDADHGLVVKLVP
jgi:rifampicin phosphotransferase